MFSELQNHFRFKDKSFSDLPFGCLNDANNLLKFNINFVPSPTILAEQTRKYGTIGHLIQD